MTSCSGCMNWYMCDETCVLYVCTIGDGTLVGVGAVVMNGARIGSCLVAAGAVVLEGTVVPDGHLVAGVPAKVRAPIQPRRFSGPPPTRSPTANWRGCTLPQSVDQSARADLIWTGVRVYLVVTIVLGLAIIVAWRIPVPALGHIFGVTRLPEPLPAGVRPGRHPQPACAPAGTLRPGEIRLLVGERAQRAEAQVVAEGQPDVAEGQNIALGHRELLHGGELEGAVLGRDGLEEELADPGRGEQMRDALRHPRNVPAPLDGTPRRGSLRRTGSPVTLPEPAGPVDGHLVGDREAIAGLNS
jgi:hypothetical protein